MFSRKFAKQGGAVVIIVALTLAVLLGFAGLVIDLGGLFVTKSELQSAVDSCALSAAKELDGTDNATTRATNAGLTAGNSNKVNFQKASAGLVSSDVTFSDSLNGSFSTASASIDATSRYARCNRQQSGITAYFMQLVGGLSSNSVNALAKATTAPSQSVCSLPLGLLPKTSSDTPAAPGYQIGEWVPMVFGTIHTPGEMGWFNMDGTQAEVETEREIKFGYCGNTIGQVVGTSGAQTAVMDAWNARFGIYKNSQSMTENGWHPDFTGYAYTSVNWPAAENAYDGSSALGSDPDAANFKNQRIAFANYANTGTTVKVGNDITGIDKLIGGFKALATAGINGEHKTHGQNKRLVGVPILELSGGTYTVKNYACMLMLQPISCVSNVCNPVQLEYRGLASAINSPCAASGLPGGGVGPLVPALVE